MSGTYQELIEKGLVKKFFQDPKTKELFDFTAELEAAWLNNKNQFSLVYLLTSQI